MPKSATERSREWREKNAKRGGRQLSVWLEADAAEKLDHLTKDGDKVADVVAKAISTLFTVASNVPAPQASLSFEVPTEPLPVACNNDMPPSPPPEVHPALSGIQGRLNQGERVSSLREEFSAVAQALTAEGLSQRKIAEAFNDAGFPTFSGTGKWGKTTVARLLQATPTQ